MVNLGADVTVLHVGVNLASRLRGPHAFRNRPDPGFDFTGGEEGPDVQQRLGFTGQPDKARFLKPHLFQKIGSFGFGQRGEFGFELAADRDRAACPQVK